MDIEVYKKYEAHMLAEMNDSAHDCQHVYRVLYLALDIANNETGVDLEILIVACLLHDIGRQRQFADPRLCHAMEGGNMAREYLLQQGWSAEQAEMVRQCIASHRYRTDNLPQSIEAKILFDADKLDVSGAMGIARTLLYKGKVNDPLYTVDNKGNVLDGATDAGTSFLHEYNFKLKNLYDKFFTQRGSELAIQRQSAAIRFYKILLNEVQTTHEQGKRYLEAALASRENNGG